MNALRKRLTYANVISSLALFLVLAGGSAFAASQLGKNSVGSKQLKKNSVTAAKIKKNAVTAAKIKANAIVAAKLKNGSITGAKVAAGTLTGANIAAGSITGAQINAPSTAFTQAVARFHPAGTVNLETDESPHLLGTYVQPAGETDQFVGGLDVSFGAGCTEADGVVILLENPANPSDPSEFDVAGFAIAILEGSGPSTVHAEFKPFEETFKGLSSVSRPTPAAHTFYAFPIDGGCKSGSGVTASNLGLDVLGTK